MRFGRIILLGVGALLLIVGVLTYLDMLGPVGFITHDSFKTSNVGLDADGRKHVASGVLCLLGGILFLLGLKMSATASRQKNRAMQIMQTGIDAQGMVTVVHNYFPNQPPMLFAVEYSYRDRNGATHSRRVERVPNAAVVARQIQVGATIPIKYAAENPTESVMLLT